MTEAAPSKTMTEGEAGLVMAFSILALLALVGAAKAEDTAFAFHAYLTAAASIAVVFGIFNHYFDRPPALSPRRRNMRSRSGMQTSGSPSSGSSTCWCSWGR
jgi:cytochrome c oxidase cbb3-type subunit I